MPEEDARHAELLRLASRQPIGLLPTTKGSCRSCKKPDCAADWLGRHQTAQRCFEEILRGDSEDHNTHYELGHQLLMLSDFTHGWREYLHRYQTEEHLQKAHTLGVPPVWDGHTDGNGILVYSDQGEGDAIMMMRYVPQLRRHFKRVFFLCGEMLADLAGTTDFFDEVIAIERVSSSRHGSIAELYCEYSTPVTALTLALSRVRSNEAAFNWLLQNRTRAYRRFATQVW